MDPMGDWPLPLQLALLIALGRLALSVLPPGEPGGGRPAELPSVLGASLILGALIERVPEVVTGGSSSSSELLLSAALVLLLARVLSLPGAIVPRHAVAEPVVGGVGRVLNVAGHLTLVWCVVARAGSNIESTAGLVIALQGAALVCFTSAARTLSVRSELRHLLLASGATWIALQGEDPGSVASALSLAAAALATEGITRWSHNADRRGRAIATTAACLLALGGGDAPGLCLGLALGIGGATARPRWRSSAALCSLIVVLTIVGTWRSAWSAGPRSYAAALVAMVPIVPWLVLNKTSGRRQVLAEAPSLAPRALMVTSLSLGTLASLGGMPHASVGVALPAIALSMLLLGPRAARTPTIEFTPQRRGPEA